MRMCRRFAHQHQRSRRFTACARPTCARWAFDAPPCLHPWTQRGCPAHQVEVRRSIAV